MKIIEKLKELKRKDNSTKGLDLLCDYNNGYIDDIISTIAFDNEDVYTYDLCEFMKNHYEYVDDAVREFGIDSKNFDILEVIRQGEYLKFTEEMNEQKELMLEIYIYNYLLNELKIEEIDDEEIENLGNINLDNIETLEELIELIKHGE